MNTHPSEADPLAADHAAPDATEKLESAACRTTEVARDNVWLVTGGLFLLGIAIGAAASQAVTPECSVRNAGQRSLHKLGKQSSRLSHDLGRKISAQLPARLRPEPTLSERLADVINQFRFW